MHFFKTINSVKVSSKLEHILAKKKQKKKYLCKNLGIKEGGGCLPERGVFSGTYDMLLS